jgi:hypothetical protein
MDVLDQKIRKEKDKIQDKNSETRFTRGPGKGIVKYGHETVLVLDLLDLDLKEHDSLDLRCVCGRRGLVRDITIPDLNRPG